MAIRMAKPEDKASWEKMWLGYQEYYEVDLSTTTENTWIRMMAPPKEGPYCLVYENEDGNLMALLPIFFTVTRGGATAMLSG